MLIRALAYDIEVRYLEGKKMLLADTLSRAYLPTQGENTASEFETVNAITCLQMSESRISQLKQETQSDQNLQTLKRTILQGWPSMKSEVQVEAAPYFHIRDELAVADGLIFRGERLVIPKSCREQMKQELHLGHPGAEGCLRRARDVLYWPGMNAEIKEWISTCESCNTFGKTQKKETMMPHKTPERKWQRIGADLFTLENKDYLVTCDYFSNFFEIDRIHKTDAKSIIHKLKAHFARFGIPDTIVTDSGTQFTSEQFSKFGKTWGFEHVTSSPHHHQSNGLAESAVKRAKRMMKMAKRSGEDQYLALLHIRNIPSPDTETSPAQRLLGRRTKGTLPITNKLLQELPPNKYERDQLELIKMRQEKYYNKGAKDLTPLKKGDIVRMKPFTLGQKEWKKAIVLDRLDERSYEVSYDNGGTFRRNRVHLNKSAEPQTPPESLPVDDQPQQSETYEQMVQPTEHPVPDLPSPKRSSRIRKMPKKFDDYVVSN